MHCTRIALSLERVSSAQASHSLVRVTKFPRVCFWISRLKWLFSVVLDTPTGRLRHFKFPTLQKVSPVAVSYYRACTRKHFLEEQKGNTLPAETVNCYPFWRRQSTRHNGSIISAAALAKPVNRLVDVFIDEVQEVIIMPSENHWNCPLIATSIVPNGVVFFMLISLGLNVLLSSEKREEGRRGESQLSPICTPSSGVQYSHKYVA